VVESRLDRADGTSDHGGDLFVAQVILIAEQEHFAVQRLKVGESV
jgi:hypothetical protein